jgi:hypothetical protein
VADVDGLACFRVGHETVVGELVLAVEHRGEAPRRTLQLRMCCDIVDTLVAQPHFAITGSETLQELFSGSSWHLGSPC